MAIDAKSTAIALTFLYGKHIYSEVKSKKDILVMLIKKPTNKVLNTTVKMEFLEHKQIQPQVIHNGKIHIT